MKQAIAEVINYIDCLDGFCQDPLAMGHIRERLQAIMDNMGDPPTDEQIEKMAEKNIPDHPYPDMEYPGDAVVKIKRTGWAEGFKAALGLNNQGKDGLVQVWVTPAMAEWISKEGLNNQQS